MQETRQVTEYRVFILCLANMHGGVDRSQPVAAFDDMDKLKDFYKSQLADEPWIDEESEDDYGRTHKWNKAFKKGSVLEWYNPISPINQRDGGDEFNVVSWCDVAFGGIIEEWWSEMPRQEISEIPFNPS